MPTLKGLAYGAAEFSRMARRRPRGWQSLMYNTFVAKMRRTGPLMRPVHVAIEPTNVCNARCPVCETGKGDMPRDNGMLKIDDFTRLIDEIWPSTSILMYYFMGEPFLNRNSYDMIRYARAKDIYVETCTNGDVVDPKGVIYSDINKISFQIGGIDDATHRRYRVRSDFGKVKRNLEALIEERARNPQSNVSIEVGFIVMRHNEHQVDDFLRWAKDIGVDRASVVDPCARNMMEAHAYLPRDRKYWFYDEAAFERGVLRPKHVPDNECVWVWNSIQLNWNGDAVPCCRDPKGLNVFGNVFEEGFDRVWNGARAREFRRAVLERQGEVSICKLCSGYGLPDLAPTKPMSFEIQRHSLDSAKLDIPPVVAAADERKRAAG